MFEKPCGLRVAVCRVVAFLFTVWCKEVRVLVATSCCVQGSCLPIHCVVLGSERPGYECCVQVVCCPPNRM